MRLKIYIYNKKYLICLSPSFSSFLHMDKCFILQRYDTCYIDIITGHLIKLLSYFEPVLQGGLLKYDGTEKRQWQQKTKMNS